MKCMACGGKMNTVRGDVCYQASGLPHVVLVEMSVDRCPACGEEELAIPKMGPLHKAIAESIATKPERLTPSEIRFLRTMVPRRVGRPEMSAAEVAKVLHVAPATLSRWENGAKSMSETAEMALRLIFIPERAVPWALDFAGTLPPRERGIRATYDGTRWRVEFERAQQVREAVKAVASSVSGLSKALRDWNGAVLRLFRTPAVAGSATYAVAAKNARQIAAEKKWTLELGSYSQLLSREAGERLASILDRSSIDYEHAA